MKKTTWIYTAAAAMAGVALLTWAFAPRPVEVEVARVTQGQFESAIEEDGKTRLRDRYVVSAPLAGVLTRVTLREGDAVVAGAVIATLRPSLSPMLDERTLRAQQLQVEIADAQVQRAHARVEGAKVGVEQARNDVRRSEQLARQGFVSPTKLDTDRLSAMSAQKELDAAIEDQHVAAHGVEQARAALVAVRGSDRTGSRDFDLRAPTSGRVLRVVQTSETAVALGSPLIELGDTTRLEVVAELLTTDALKARPGSRVTIERWGGDCTLQGNVRAVEPGAYTKVSALGVEEQRVKVLIDITSAPNDWRALGDAYRVVVRIVTQSVDGALKVPVSAVFPLPDREGEPRGRMAVFTVDDGRARMALVQVGGRNGADAWLQQGPKPGATVIVYPPAAIKDGARVKVRAV